MGVNPYETRPEVFGRGKPIIPQKKYHIKTYAAPEQGDYWKNKYLEVTMELDQLKERLFALVRDISNK